MLHMKNKYTDISTICWIKKGEFFMRRYIPNIFYFFFYFYDQNTALPESSLTWNGSTFDVGMLAHFHKLATGSLMKSFSVTLANNNRTWCHLRTQQEAQPAPARRILCLFYAALPHSVIRLPSPLVFLLVHFFSRICMQMHFGKSQCFVIFISHGSYWVYVSCVQTKLSVSFEPGEHCTREG